MITREEVTQAVLGQRTQGWKIVDVQDTAIPDAGLPYAQDAQAWSVSVIKQWNELGDDPWWLKGTDQETHQMYYDEQGEAARTMSRLELDLVIWSSGQFHVFPMKPLKSEGPQDGVITLGFTLEFPENLEQPVEGK